MSKKINNSRVQKKKARVLNECVSSGLLSVVRMSWDENLLNFWQAHKLVQLFVKAQTFISSVQSLSHVQIFATPRTAACQASLSITSPWNLLKLMSIELIMSSNHLIFCHPLLLLPSILPRNRVFHTISLSSRSSLAPLWFLP